MRKTRIVCTLGPAVNKPEMIEKLIDAGMNVARFNFSHGDHESHGATFKMVDEIRTRLDSPLATLIDTKGPEVRTVRFEGDKAELIASSSITLTNADVLGTSSVIPITHKSLFKDVKAGDTILLDDGLIELTVERIDNEDIICTVINGGIIKNNKGINIPGVDLSLPYLSEKDIADIKFGASIGFDFIAASFVNTAADILEIRKLLKSVGREDMGVIAKIESDKGVQNIDEILEASDGIMVARGDLGVEIPMSEVPVVQKNLVKKALNTRKIVIIATQMLESMTQNPRPTRAEAADVANAIYDGASAIMLSGETAAGAYPIEAVKAMHKIAVRIESDINYSLRAARLNIHRSCRAYDRTTAIAHATCSTAADLDAAAIVTVTCSGHTARMISSFHPATKVYSCTPSMSTYRQMSLYWGVTPLLVAHENDSTDKLFRSAIDTIESAGYVKPGDLVLITAGVPIGIPGTTNLMKAHVIGDAVVY